MSAASFVSGAIVAIAGALGICGRRALRGRSSAERVSGRSALMTTAVCSAMRGTGCNTVALQLAAIHCSAICRSQSLSHSRPSRSLAAGYIALVITEDATGLKHNGNGNISNN